MQNAVDSAHHPPAIYTLTPNIRIVGTVGPSPQADGKLRSPVNYCLQHEESTADGIRRVVAEQIDGAVTLIEDAGTPREVALHEARKTCKKVRGALRLIRDHFDGYRAENARFRNLARQLSDLRDLQVLGETHRTLTDSMPEKPQGAGVEEVSAALDECIREKLHGRANTQEESLAAVRAGLASAGRAVGGWHINFDDLQAPAGGLRRTYKRSRNGLERCLDDPSPANLHEWRKRAKYHWYHMCLLSNVWPEVIPARAAAEHDLAAMLGEDRDLFVYSRVLAEIKERAPDSDIELLSDRAGECRDTIQQESFALGKRLFAEKPDAFVQRFQAYWQAWRQ